MTKKILITGSTDGIGLETAKQLVSLGHHVLLHGRSANKLEAVANALRSQTPQANVEEFVADLSSLSEVMTLANTVKEHHSNLDVLINNAGVYGVPSNQSPDGLDVRFTVNTIAPYLLTQALLPLMGDHGRVINLSSAAQASLVAEALAAPSSLPDNTVYAQSKLALTMWSRHLADSLGQSQPAIIAVNPASMLASKMVKQAYGVHGNDLSIGADILVKSALSDEFSNASGRYFDNDIGQFTLPHADAQSPKKNKDIVDVIDTILARCNH